MDRVAVALEASEKAEGEEANEQAHERKQDAHPGNDVQEHFVNRVCVLQKKWEQKVLSSINKKHKIQPFYLYSKKDF